MPATRPFRVFAVAVVTAVLVGSCGGDDDSAETTPSPDTEPATTPEDTEPPEATTSPPTDPPATEPPATEPPATDMVTTTESPTTTAPPETTAAETTSPTDVPADTACVPVTVDTGDTTIPGERCDPDDSFAAPRPAAIVLNGCGGYDADSEITSASVRALAERGIVGLRIDFLAAEPAPPDTYCEAGPVIGAVQPLLTAVVDGVATLRADPTIDPDRIGTASYSLGALAAMGAELGGAGLTTVDPLQLSAAALLSFPNQLPTIPAAASEGVLPPLFLMTGENDTVAPPADSQALADAATEGGIPAELVIVPDQDHPWRGEAALTAAAAMADFLATELGA